MLSRAVRVLEKVEVDDAYRPGGCDCAALMGALRTRIGRAVLCGVCEGGGGGCFGIIGDELGMLRL